MTNPHLLILDEATEGLSPLIRKEIWAVLAAQGRRPGDPGDRQVPAGATRVADRHTFIEKGRSCWQGDNAALAAEPGLAPLPGV